MASQAKNQGGSRSPQRTLAVVGAGPKGVAIAAKAAVLTELGMQAPRVVLIDKQGVASNWSGGSGFTDGKQPLGTPPEKDIGFPYDSRCWGDYDESVDRLMALWSWHGFLIANGRYANWVDRGRPQPTHMEWGAYLEWVVRESEAELIKAEAKSFSVKGGRWQITGSARRGLILEADGLVLTGPGVTRPINGQPPKGHSRVMDGRTFWKSRDTFKPVSDETVAVIGSGETAASIVCALVETAGKDAVIDVISRHAALYSRGESFHENRWFSDVPDDWPQLGIEHRREFIKRTDRSVFSVQAMSVINGAGSVECVPGEVTCMLPYQDAVRLDLEYGGATETRSYDYVIVATGFDPISFLDQLDQNTRKALADAVGVGAALDGRLIEQAIEFDLTVGGFNPPLHLPMLAALQQGPGFPNLSCLGRVSDRILRSHVH